MLRFSSSSSHSSSQSEEESCQDERERGRMNEEGEQRVMTEALREKVKNKKKF